MPMSPVSRPIRGSRSVQPAQESYSPASLYGLDFQCRRSQVPVAWMVDLRVLVILIIPLDLLDGKVEIAIQELLVAVATESPYCHQKRSLFLQLQSLLRLRVLRL